MLVVRQLSDTGSSFKPGFPFKRKVPHCPSAGSTQGKIVSKFSSANFFPFFRPTQRVYRTPPLYIVNGKAGFIVDAGAIYIQVPNFRNYFIGSAVIQAKGLGLHLVRSMVEKTGGKIEVDSEEGRGSRFYVYFKDLT